MFQVVPQQLQLQQQVNTAAGATGRAPVEQHRSADTAGVNQYEGSMRNILKTVITVVVVYYVIWTPYELMFILQYCGLIALNFTGWQFRLSLIMTYLGCLINPLIYAVKYRDFKQALNRMVSRIGQQSQSASVTVRTNVF